MGIDYHGIFPFNVKEAGLSLTQLNRNRSESQCTVLGGKGKSMGKSTVSLTEISEKVALRCSQAFLDHSRVRFTANERFVVLLRSTTYREASNTSVAVAHGLRPNRMTAAPQHCNTI